MSKPSRKLLPTVPVSRRPGDQYFIDVALSTEITTSGETISTLGLKVDRVPVPERKFVADVCYITHNSTGVKAIFGQLKLAEDQIRAAVVIKLSRRGVALLIDAFDEVNNPSYAEIAEREKLAPVTLNVLANEPEQVVSLAANIAISAMSGEEASIDFLQVSPFSIANMHKGARQVSIDPVVRIDLHSELFLGLVAALRQVPGVSEAHGRLTTRQILESRK